VRAGPLDQSRFLAGSRPANRHPDRRRALPARLRAGNLDRFGHYVNVAARLAQFAVEREDLVGLILYADRPTGHIDTGTRRPAPWCVCGRCLRQLAWSAPNPIRCMRRPGSDRWCATAALIVMLTDIDDASAKSQLTAGGAVFCCPKHLPFVAGLFERSGGVAGARAGPAVAGPLSFPRGAGILHWLGAKSPRIECAPGAPALVARAGTAGARGVCRVCEFPASNAEREASTSAV